MKWSKSTIVCSKLISIPVSPSMQGYMWSHHVDYCDLAYQSCSMWIMSMFKLTHSHSVLHIDDWQHCDMASWYKEKSRIHGKCLALIFQHSWLCDMFLPISCYTFRTWQHPPISSFDSLSVWLALSNRQRLLTLNEQLSTSVRSRTWLVKWRDHVTRQ